MASIVDPERFFINKWEMYKILKTSAIKEFNFPETDVLSIESLNRMLNRYLCLYVKSVSTWGGEKIGKIEKQENGYGLIIQSITNNSYASIDDLYKDLRHFYNDGTTIIQQQAPLLHYQNRVFDIRSHLQRELDETWVYEGDLVRVGGTDSIVSNIEISNGMVMPTNEILAVLFPQKPYEFFLNKMKSASKTICGILDKYHYFMEVGIDYGLDDTGNLWLIEVNTDDVFGGPEQKLFSMLPDKSIYDRLTNRSQKIHEQWLHYIFESYEELLKNQSNN
ncbi:YheC/YheD family protein [Schinkia azotoformans]|uniref:YheC/YheD family protein n=1 Tax=Schinkia azotoformans TaxID=1454 RepID=UPI002DBBB9EE|nr:YheC/YheD family protein [Schinkia azotoformans]MEC1721429.1 YheC/YheD family protein [Schinkia azotoformans]MED4414687.1 YheC/YheD family protein [Schinkia azotoformans]